MKKLFMFAAMFAAVMSSCEKIDEDAIKSLTEADDEETIVVDGEVLKTKKFTFTLKGDFSDEWKPVTRAYLNADGRDLTDVWVLDYMDGNLVQQVHQSDNTAEDFGKPVMQLAYGSHHIYFIASNGITPTLDTDAKTITFAKVVDTFYKDYSVDVVSTSNGNRAVTLDRIATKLRLTFNDVIPADAATISITPASWYYGWNYVTATPCSLAAGQTTTINIPESQKGKTGAQASLYGFSTSTQWTTNVTIVSKKVNNDVLGSATISDVPFKANRTSDFAGPLFTSGGTLTMSLNGTWEDAVEGTW